MLLEESSEVREAEGWWGDRWMGTGAGMALGDPEGPWRGRGWKPGEGNEEEVEWREQKLNPRIEVGGQ